MISDLEGNEPFVEIGQFGEGNRVGEADSCSFPHLLVHFVGEGEGRLGLPSLYVDRVVPDYLRGLLGVQILEGRHSSRDAVPVETCC